MQKTYVVSICVLSYPSYFSFDGFSYLEDSINGLQCYQLQIQNSNSNINYINGYIKDKITIEINYEKISFHHEQMTWMSIGWSYSLAVQRMFVR